MSLRTVTDKLDFIIQATALVCALAFGVVYGFSPVWEFVAFGCLIIVCALGYKWTTSQAGE